MADKKRMAGDALYSGEKEYGRWGETWNAGAEQQQLKASGAYDADSALAKQFKGLKEDGRSRVDNEKGWRELVFDDDAKGASNYKDLVTKWSNAGFDIRAIDMGKGFGNSNIAVRRSTGKGTGKDPFENVDMPSEGGNNSSNSTTTIDGSFNTGTDIRDSFNNGMNTTITNSQTQNVTQDNDINQTIGDGNTVTNNVDNSVSQQSNGYGVGFLGDFMKKYDFFK